MRARILKDDALIALCVVVVLAEFVVLGPLSVWLFAGAVVPTMLVFDDWHVRTLRVPRRTLVDRLRRRAGRRSGGKVSCRLDAGPGRVGGRR